MPLSTPARRLGTALAFVAFLLIVAALGSRCGRTGLDTELRTERESGTVTARPPAATVIAGPSGASIFSPGPAPVVAVDSSGRVRIVRPEGVRFPVGAVLTLPGRSAAAVRSDGSAVADSGSYAGPVLIAVEGRRASFLPDFRRPVVGVAAFDTLGRPIEGSGRPVVATQARPAVQFGFTVRVGAQASPGHAPAAFVAVSPVRVWGFRPDAAVSLRRDSTGTLAAGASLGVSLDVLPALAVRAGYGVAGADAGPVAGVAFRF